MLKKALMLAALAVAMITPVGAWGSGNSVTTFTITGTVDTFAEWADPAPAIVAGDWSGHITAVAQSQTVTHPLTLWTNVNTTITPSAGTNSSVMTNGTQTLTTAYEVTGSVTAPDSGFKLTGTGAGQFFNASNTYTVTHVAGTGAYTVNVVAQMTSPANAAPDAGNYTCGLVLTAAW